VSHQVEPWKQAHFEQNKSSILLYPTLDEPALIPPDASLGYVEILVWVIIRTIQLKIPSQESILSILVYGWISFKCRSKLSLNVENAAPRMGGTFNSFHFEFVDGMNFC
jgi:hypothetical protein